MPERNQPTLLLAVAGLVLGPLTACTPAPPDPLPPLPTPGAVSRATPISDFDGDGSADVVVGAAGDPASVQVRYAGGDVQTITRADLDGAALDTRFGASVLARDLNADGYADLAIGDRGNDEANEALFLVFGSAEGLQPEAASRYEAPDGVSRFGSSLALVEDPDPVLVVGAPGDVEGGYVGGVIVTYRLGDDGRPRFNPQVLTQDSPGMPADAEVGDRFGEAVAASGSLLLVGAPLEDIGPVREAGAIIALTFTNYGFEATRISKRSRGVAGSPTTGDFFGGSLGIGDGFAVVGAPGQDAGRRRDVGAIQPFAVRDGTLEPLAAIDQDSPGVPDSGEAGDAFGTAVAVVRPCPGVVGALVGAPGEGVSGARAAGAAWVVPFTAARSCPARSFAGGRGLGPAPAAGKRIGTAVAALRGTDPAAPDGLLVAGPGDAASGGGTVFELSSPTSAARARFTSLRTPYGISLGAAR